MRDWLNIMVLLCQPLKIILCMFEKKTNNPGCFMIYPEMKTRLMGSGLSQKHQDKMKCQQFCQGYIHAFPKVIRIPIANCI